MAMSELEAPLQRPQEATGFSQPPTVLVEFAILPLGRGEHVSGEIAEAVKVVAASGLPYQLTAAGTCMEGPWDEVMRVIRQAHNRVRQLSPHVVTVIKVEEDRDRGHKLVDNVTSVTKKLNSDL